MELDEIRMEINTLDEKIVELLEKRFNFVLEVGKYKKAKNLQVLDESRENAVIENCKKHLQNEMYDDYLGKIYMQIMNTCKEIQKDKIV
ncbi:MAG: chorismate mutase [Sedimentibacter sp.]